GGPDGAVVGAAGGVRGDVPAVSLDRERGADLLRLRLGVAAAGGRIPGGFPGLGPDRDAGGDDRGDQVAGVPGGIRGWADQDPRGRGVAQPDRAELSPPDAADAGAAELVLPPPAWAAAQGGGGGQPCGAAGGTVPAVRPAAGGHVGGGGCGGHPAVAGGLGELRLAELADDDPGVCGGQRPCAD